jgi:predicted ester cyclase
MGESTAKKRKSKKLVGCVSGEQKAHDAFRTMCRRQFESVEGFEFAFFTWQPTIVTDGQDSILGLMH